MTMRLGPRAPAAARRALAVLRKSSGPKPLPELPDAQDGCVQRLIALLHESDGIEKAPVVNDQGKAPSLCMHYDPEVLALAQVERIARLAGASILEKYGHAVLGIRLVNSEDAAGRVEGELRRIPGILAASVSLPAQVVRIEYERSTMSLEQIESVLRAMRLLPTPSLLGQPSVPSHAAEWYSRNKELVWKHGPVGVDLVTGGLQVYVPGPSYPVPGGTMSLAPSYSDDVTTDSGLGQGWTLGAGAEYAITNNFTAKVDHNFSAKDRLTGRYLYNSDDTSLTSVFPEPAADTQNIAIRHQNYFYGNWTRTVSATIVNDFRMTYSNRVNHAQSQGLGGPWASRIGMARDRNQRNSPFAARRGKVSSHGSPVSNDRRMRSTTRSTWSGWWTLVQPHPRICRKVAPV